MRRYIADRGIANSSIAASAATPLIPYLLELVGESLKFLVRERLDIDHAMKLVCSCFDRFPSVLNSRRAKCQGGRMPPH